MTARRVLGGLARFVGGAALALAALSTLATQPAAAQAFAPGPYDARPSGDPTLPSATRFIVLTHWNNNAVLDRETRLVWERPRVRRFALEQWVRNPPESLDLRHAAWAQVDAADTCPYSRPVKIEWDLSKASANLRDHGVPFAEAATVLADDYALTREDPDAIGEQRFVTLGMSATGVLLVVVYSHREPDIYRLISSWKANKPQRKQYEKGRR